MCVCVHIVDFFFIIPRIFSSFGAQVTHTLGVATRRVASSTRIWRTRATCNVENNSVSN